MTYDFLIYTLLNQLTKKEYIKNSFLINNENFSIILKYQYFFFSNNSIKIFIYKNKHLNQWSETITFVQQLQTDSS